MGLDMFLFARKNVREYVDEAPNTGNIKPLKTMLAEYDTGRTSLILSVIICQWRNANQIHKWFVDNVQAGTDDQGYNLVTRDQLQGLVDLCNQTLSHKEKAIEVLPPMKGFFFGNTDIDDDYFEELQETSAKLTQILSDPRFDETWQFYYSSWW